MQKYNIEQISYGVLGNADQIEITIGSFSLGEIPRVIVSLKNSEKTLETKLLEMPEETYQNWGTDDQVVIDWVLDELNLTAA